MSPNWTSVPAHDIPSFVVMKPGGGPSADGRAWLVALRVESASQIEHFIDDYSISVSDESIAFSLSLPDSSGSSGLFSINLRTMGHLGSTSQELTSFGDELTSPSVAAPAWNQDGIIAYLRRHELIPTGQKFAPGPELVGTTTGIITPSNLHVQGFSWSLAPDTLVFSAKTDDQLNKGQFGGNGIYTVDLNGGVLTKIVDCDQGLGLDSCGTPQWSPTENVIAYERSGDIHLVNGNGSGDHVAIANGGNPVWSPQSGLIAFECGDDVCVASEDGAGRVNITNRQGGARFSEPAWAADESLLAVVGRPQASGVWGDIFVASNGGKTLIQVTNTSDARAPQWSPILPSTTSNPPKTSAPAFELFFICQRNLSDELCLFTGLGTPTTCDPTTCGGCCSQGVCLPGTTAEACGLNGVSCANCPGLQVCNSLGLCSNPSACGISSCSGCCDSSNQCHGGDSSKACGKKGEPCARCYSGEICTSDQGICEAQLCSAANCSGCCGADGKCYVGTANSACGANGLSCQACNSGEKCTTSRLCEKQGCDISNCSGCCIDGVCKPGNTASACGSGGFACMDCRGQSCDANARTCVTPQTCLAGSCSGCCAGNQCQIGNTASSCGSDGFNCTACNSGERCGNGFCQ